MGQGRGQHAIRLGKPDPRGSSTRPKVRGTLSGGLNDTSPASPGEARSTGSCAAWGKHRHRETYAPGEGAGGVGVGVRCLGKAPVASASAAWGRRRRSGQGRRFLGQAPGTATAVGAWRRRRCNSWGKHRGGRRRRVRGGGGAPERAMAERAYTRRRRDFLVKRTERAVANRTEHRQV